MSDFWASGMSGILAPTDSKNVPQSLRQKIALAMLMQKRAYPKTFGEGLAAIGDAIGDRYGIMGIEKDAAAAEVAGQKARDEYTGTTSIPASVKPASYAPADDTAPAVAAPTQPPVLATMQSQHPDMLAQQKQPLVTTPPAQQPSPTMFSPPAATPPPMQGRPPGPQAGVVGDEYNMLDAQAGMKRRGQGRVQDALLAAYPGNPDMQAYGSQLAAGEQQVPGDTSKTGARGPWQFVPGTARQYGLSNPDDPMASAQALKAFTADNAATFERINGRPPTMADLSLMHQQGGATGANMVAGTGNASPRNLALNNVPPGAGPQAAATQIKGYYGLPERPVDPRGAATAALVAQQAPPAGLPPEITGGASQPGGQPMAFSGQPTPPAPQPQIRTAPPPQAAPQPRPAPPQAGPEAGYVPTLGPAPTPPQTQTPGMVKIQNIIRNTPPSQRESVIEALKEPYAQEQAKLAQENVIYQDLLKRHHEREKQVEDAKISQRSRVDASREAEQRIKKGDIPEVKQDIETGLTYNSNTGQWEQPKIAGADADRKPPFKGTEFQGKALVNYGRAKIAHEGLTAAKDGTTGEDRLASSPVQSALGSVPVVGGVTRAFRSDAYKEADTHADNFVQAFIRQQSGGAYGREELEQEARGMLPRLGDTTKQIESKREQREQFLNGLYNIVGPSGQKGLEIDARKREEERAAREQTKQDKPAVDPLDKREILMPDGTIKVRRDGKWVPK